MRRKRPHVLRAACSRNPVGFRLGGQWPMDRGATQGRARKGGHQGFSHGTPPRRRRHAARLDGRLPPHRDGEESARPRHHARLRDERAAASDEHGFPLRLIAPGWAGDSWVKWLTHIEVLDHEWDGFWMKTAYRHPSKPVAPGTAVDASQMFPVTDLGVKSVIANPGPGPVPGVPVRISGAAWSNGSPVTGVDVSVDGGNTWNQAKLGESLGRYSWRLYEYSWTPNGDGDYEIMARARNQAGQIQPLEQEWNPSGYLWNVVHRVPVKFSYPNGYRAACLGCHDERMMVQQHITRAQWDREVDKMVRWGAEIKADDREGIMKYLSDRFK